VDLNHSFTVPASLADTWKTFEDIESVAGCFPGAVVTSVEGNDFKGTCKVKLGPIAMLYSGSGTFLEKDEAAGKFVIDAKGKDKRGNGTAGAVVTAQFVEESPGTTRVDVATDLAITGKPAQFGRGVIEDISNKLLQQFVTCLQDKVGVGEEPPSTAPDSGGEVEDLAPRETSLADAAPGGTDDVPAGSASSRPSTADAPRPATSSSAAAGGSSDDALDLGATVLPILARTYGPQVGLVLVGIWIGWRLGRLGRR
jgi:carbon monoxide dehydrogenase subunit G